MKDTKNIRKKEGSLFAEPYDSKITSFRLNYWSLASIRALIRITHASTAVSVMQQALEFYLNHIPELFPFYSKEDVHKIVEEELQVLAEQEAQRKTGSRKAGRPKKKTVLDKVTHNLREQSHRTKK